MLLLAGNNALEFVLILIIFILVLVATYFVTRWAANIQKGKNGRDGDIELLSCAALGTGKYIQIVRVGRSYYALAVCKDTVTLLGEVSSEELKEREEEPSNQSFKQLLMRACGKVPESKNELKDTENEDSQTY